MHLKLFLHILLIITISPIALADDPPRIYEEKAAEMLRDVSEIIKSHDAIHLEFRFSQTDSPMSANGEMDGFLYASGEKYYFRYGDMHFISDGHTAWSYLEDVNEVHISLREDTEGAITPLSIIENFEEEFRPLWINQVVHEGTAFQIIDLVSKEPHTFFKYRIAVNKENGNLMYVTAYDRQGGTYTYSITETTIDPEVPDDLFIFDPADHHDIEVVDLR